MEIYSQMPDNELLELSGNGDGIAEQELILRYTRLVKICSRPLFLVGGDGEDLIQEGMIGLLSAIREYKFDMNTSFKTFAELCIKRRIYSAIKTASRKKHEPLNEMVSFDDVLLNESQSQGAYITTGFSRETEERVLSQDNVEEYMQKFSQHLSKLENRVLELFLRGLSYNEIAHEISKTEKSVDNAISRIRRKQQRTPNHSDISES